MERLVLPLPMSFTVQECLSISMTATGKLHQHYTFVTMGLAAAKFANDIKWSSGNKFSNVVIHLDAFHTMCSYMGALGKMVIGSGFEEILVESGIWGQQVNCEGSVRETLQQTYYMCPSADDRGPVKNVA